MSEETQALFQKFIDDYGPTLVDRRTKFIGRLAELISQAGSEVTQKVFAEFRGGQQ